MTQLNALFSPIRVGSLELKNRLVMAPMALHYADEKGMLSDRQIAYYTARARGGVGLILSESNYVTPDGRGGVHRLGLYEDRMIPDHQKLTEAVHAAGGLIFAQLHHGGATISPGSIGQFPVSCSATPLMVKGEPYIGIIPRKLTVREIKEIVNAFGEAARRAKQAGFDGVQVLAGHGYLINEFLSPHNNRRSDAYGGKRENRARILLEVISAIRERVGADYPLSVRLTGCEFLPDGYGLEFTCWLVQQLEDAVNEVSITGGTYDERDWMVPPMRIPEGFQVEQAAEIKRAASIPVSVVGRIVDPVMADQIIGGGKADLIYMGRALLADPDLPNKAREGRLDEIRHCIGCNRGCIDRLFNGLDIMCSVNPEVGREVEDAVHPANASRKVMVVGAGPAGMEAARVAALRGHQVTVVEKDGELGGNLRRAAKPPFRQSIDRFRRYQEAQLSKTDVKVMRETTATPELVEGVNPDVLVVATGATCIRPAIPGVGLKKVVTAEDLLDGRADLGERIVIVGAGIVGLETAEFLVEREKQVTVIEETDKVGGDEEGMSKKMLLLRLSDAGVPIYINSRIEEVSSQGVSVTRLGRLELVPADQVVLATGYQPNRGFLATLDAAEREILQIGDCKEARNILAAVREGFWAGRQV